MNRHMVLSIIVPVYNVEKYIEKCLQSIFSQLTQEVEVIIVDDCTSDASIEIAERLSNGLGNVRIVRREKNGGLSAARNSGLENASGKYVWFVDSDDYICDGAIAFLIKKAEENMDLYCFNHTRVKEDGKFVLESCLQNARIELFSNDKLYTFVYRYLTNRYGFEVWNKLYRRELIQAEKLEFQPNKKVFAEDICFNLMFFSKCNTVSTLEEKLYVYLLRDSSIMGTKNEPKIKEMENLAMCVKIYTEGRYDEIISIIYFQLLMLELNALSWNQIDEYMRNVVSVELMREMCRGFLKKRKYAYRADIRKAFVSALLISRYCLANEAGKNTVLLKKCIDLIMGRETQK
ncbi:MULTISPECIES: glycosyltransferase [Clostridia]|uniref:glycosyltransferase family 2 protein n=1 Tax=Clostridia TaxID=186801 RepID=UPI001A9B430C|nr:MULTISPECIES: glycosyltransferase [Clostridia]